MSRPTAHAQAFSAYLASLVPSERDPSRRGNRAALATLRRSLGKDPGEDAGPYRYVGRWLPRGNQSFRQDEWYYLVAGLFALHQISWADEEGAHAPYWRNFGASFARLTRDTENGRDSIERRFVALLNSHVDDLPHHLRQAVSLLKAKGVPVDWAWLLDDLLGWERRGGAVRREWAHAFWGDQGQSADTASEGAAVAVAPAEDPEED